LQLQLPPATRPPLSPAGHWTRHPVRARTAAARRWTATNDFEALPHSPCCLPPYPLAPNPPQQQDALYSRALLAKRAAEVLLDRGARADYDAWLSKHPAPAHAVAAADAAGALSLLQEAGEWGTVLAAADELLARPPAGTPPQVKEFLGAAKLFAARGGALEPPRRAPLTPPQRSDVAVAAARAAAAAGAAVTAGGASGAAAVRRAVLHARGVLLCEGDGAPPLEALALQLRELAADLAVPVVEEHLAQPRPAAAVAAAAAAADPAAAAEAAAGRADALRCLAALLFGLGDQARLEGRARERILALVRGGLTAAEQVRRGKGQG
jgi:hypothetical protein